MITTEETRQDIDFIPYKKLAQAIILRAIKDYSEKRGWHKTSVRRWVEERGGTFDLCVVACGRIPEDFQKMMIEKMDAMDGGEPMRLDDRVIKRN